MRSKRDMAFKIILLQTVIPLLAALLSYFLLNTQIALSLISGAIVVVLPTWLFALKLFQYQGARYARRIVNAFYLGEALKLLATAILFGLVILFVPIQPLVFFITAFLVQIVAMFASLVINQ